MSDQFCPFCMREVDRGIKICPVCGCGVDITAPKHHLPIGTVLRNEKGHSFLFGAVKGEGGFGLTYIGKELVSGKLVAIKEYFPTRCQPQRYTDLSVHPQERSEDIYKHGMQSFLSEASMLRAVSHLPSIVHVMDYFEANKTAYMVMEYLEGHTLYHVMQERERIDPETLIQKFLPLMHNLESLHKAGVLHRDIAPDNIMWMPDGNLKLLDFGCARSLEDGRSMTVVLKPGFAPIEQYQTRGQGAYTDLYALCATLYYCITGIVPPASPERLTITFDNQPDPLLPPSAYGVSIPPEEEQTLMWGLSLQPSVRPQSMETFVSRLEQACASHSEPVQPQRSGSLTGEGNQGTAPRYTEGQNTVPDESDAQSTTYQGTADGGTYPAEERSIPGNRGKKLLLLAGVAAGVAIALAVTIIFLL